MGKLIYSGNEIINLRELLKPTFKLNLGTRMEGYDSRGPSHCFANSLLNVS
jgi:hypothetical protein